MPARPNLKLPPDIEEALRRSGKILTVEMGARHLKLKLDGKLVGILRTSDKKLDLGNGGAIRIATQLRKAIEE